MFGQLLGALTGRLAMMQTGHWVAFFAIAVVAFIFARSSTGASLAAKVGLS